MKKPFWVLILLFFVGFSVLLIPQNAESPEADVPETDPIPKKNFTIAVLPDTQKYTINDERAKIYEDQVRWIVENQEQENIVFVAHMGDIVERGSKEDQWERASKAMKILEDANIPHGVIPGNHDLDIARDPERKTEMYDRYFGRDRYKDVPWWGQSSFPEGSNKNNFQTFEAEGYKFLMLNLEYAPLDDVFPWADQVIWDHPDHLVILTTHQMLDTDELTLSDSTYGLMGGNTGNDLWNYFVADKCNIIMILSGHWDGENHGLFENVCGEEVLVTVQNYQKRKNGGNGWLRLYEFDPNNKIVQGVTYSPTLNKYEIDENSSFTAPIRLQEL